MIKQYVTTVEINREKIGYVPLCMHAAFKCHGGDWKRGWTFEAISVEFPACSHVPKLDKSQKISPQNEPEIFENPEKKIFMDTTKTAVDNFQKSTTNTSKSETYKLKMGYKGCNLI